MGGLLDRRFDWRFAKVCLSRWLSSRCAAARFEAQTPSFSTSKMSDADLQAIAVYFKNQWIDCDILIWMFGGLH
jgi:hypothetical protein